MQNLRALGLLGLGVIALTAAALLTFSLTLVLGVVLTGTLAWRALTLKPKPVAVHARKRQSEEQQPVRIWNDGRGTIIDM
ncbi:hypothetical protein G6L63_14225 [Agrobacterium vitis]|uniref:Uncharacterized protein n=1 Tax=Agrobacterium vitis TaxID=373 RepID=A0A368NS06_AGRVI|nr:hypothetical protein [Agrobacterium vitis]KAA3516721.1 hypothetical protein DXM22_09485 [Agrobacterium vitis]KAA3529486.1 hypothetical protein DXT89_07005 [Agrobacterium vitis]MCF1477531.1 hypothetical protein [Agrobacterium vitis]MUZ97256.1 hypothetical protein [Agrobacterium vitis]MVA28266.1 hypothetical protein [Agrobacterium vitis]